VHGVWSPVRDSAPMSSSRSRDQEEGEERARRKVTSHAVKVIWGLVAGGGGPRPTLRLEENARSSTEQQYSGTLCIFSSLEAHLPLHCSSTTGWWWAGEIGGRPLSNW
jgi:hypothetical protein